MRNIPENYEPSPFFEKLATTLCKQVSHYSPKNMITFYMQI